MKLKDEWRQYTENKKNLGEKSYSYPGYWLKILEGITPEKMMDYKYKINYTEEYKEYKEKANNVLSYQVYKKHRNKKSMQELIEEKKPKISKRKYNIEYRKQNSE